MTFDPLSFTAAKRLVFETLVRGIGPLATLPGWKCEEGRNAFLGYLPPCFDVWAITFGGGGTVAPTWNVKGPSELHLNADIEGVFREMDVADEVGMKLVSSLAIFRVDRAGASVPSGTVCFVQCFRLRSGGQIDVFLDPRVIANEGPMKQDGSREAIPVWILKIGCELVFNTAAGT